MIQALEREHVETKRTFRFSQHDYIERLSVREKLCGIRPADQLKTPEHRAAQYAALEAMTGNTPLMRFDLPTGSIVWAKMESENPGSESHYDRAALATFKDLETANIIRPGDTILEVTSGSAGRSFAYFARALGYKALIVTPKGEELPKDRRKDILTLGATLMDADEFADDKEGPVVKAINKFRSFRLGLIKDYGFKRTKYPRHGTTIEVFTDQMTGDRICATNHAESNITPQSFGQIAEEAIAQVPEGTTIDTFIGTLGNGSTVKGISEVLRRHNPELHVIGTEDIKAPVWYVTKYGEQHFIDEYGQAPTYQRHDTFGASNKGYNPPFIVGMLERGELSEVRLMGDEWKGLWQVYNGHSYRNFDDANTLGHTSAQNLNTAIQYGNEHPGTNILVLFYDKADQYADWSLLYKIPTYLMPIRGIPDRNFHSMVDEAQITKLHQENLRKWTRARGTVVKGKI